LPRKIRTTFECAVDLAQPRFQAERVRELDESVDQRLMCVREGGRAAGVACPVGIHEALQKSESLLDVPEKIMPRYPLPAEQLKRSKLSMQRCVNNGIYGIAEVRLALLLRPAFPTLNAPIEIVL